MQTTAPVFRAATEADCSDLAILLDAASRRIVSWIWSGMAEPGQSWFEVGRERIRNNADSTSYYKNWLVVQKGDRVAGAMYGFLIEKPYVMPDLSEVPKAIHPLIELDQVAQGTWYLQVAAVFPEYRGQGLGTAILNHAESLATDRGATQISLAVEGDNIRAHQLYLRHGFREWATRPFVPFPGSDDTADWILMVKDLEGHSYP
jgi:ribosomal protein S18 acetylase RimI-like enzyme